jgi:hypothetical protein
MFNFKVAHPLTSDFRLPTSDFRLPTSDFRLPTSDFRLPTSNFRLPTSSLSLPHRSTEIHREAGWLSLYFNTPVYVLELLNVVLYRS